MTRPVRTCTGCRERGEKTELIRMVMIEDAVHVDLPQVRPGRGAYLHPSESCLDRALKRRAIGRALRASVDPEQVDAALRPALRAHA